MLSVLVTKLSRQALQTYNYTVLVALPRGACYLSSCITITEQNRHAVHTVFCTCVKCIHACVQCTAVHSCGMQCTAVNSCTIYNHIIA